MTGQDIEKTLLAEGQRKIIERLSAIEQHLKPKTTAEQLAIIKNTSTAEEWQRIVDERIELASLDEVVEAVAEAEGVSVAEYTNPTYVSMRVAEAIAKQARVDDENARKAEMKQRLIEQADAL